MYMLCEKKSWRHTRRTSGLGGAMGGLKGRLFALSRVLVAYPTGARRPTIAPKKDSDPKTEGRGEWIYLCLVVNCQKDLARQPAERPPPVGCPDHGARHPVYVPPRPALPDAARASDGLFIYVCRDGACRRRPQRKQSLLAHAPRCDGTRHTGRSGETVLAVRPKD